MAFTKTTENKMLAMTESLLLPDSEGGFETSVNSATILADINDKKILVGLEVTEVSAGDGDLEVRLQASIFGSVWATIATTTALHVDNTGLNSASVSVDLTNYFAPYWRVQVFSDGTDTADDCTVSVNVATVA